MNPSISIIQFIQIMDEPGVLGLAAFVGLLGSAVWMLTAAARMLTRCWPCWQRA